MSDVTYCPPNVDCPCYAALTAENEKLRAEIERLRTALEPFSRLFLYPDDLGFAYAEDIRADDDWCDDANDMQTENVFVVRGYIRRARAALEEK